MMIKREIHQKKPDDEENINKGIDLIYKTMQDNDYIDDNLWFSSMCYVIANGFLMCNVSYKDFRRVVDNSLSALEILWNNNEEEL